MMNERREVVLVYERADFENLRDRARILHMQRTGGYSFGLTLEEVLVDLAFAAGVKAAGGTLGF